MACRLLASVTLAGLALAAPAAAPAAAGAASSPAGRPIEVSFSVEARLESPALDATIEASARLLMEGRPRPQGGLDLSLLRPLEPAWKLYWVDPLGPLAEQAELAAEVTLPEGSWEALAAARAEVDRLGEERFRRWAESRALAEVFNGGFAFVVIGPAAGRFRVEVSPGGRVLGVVNRLTDRWLPGEFDRLVKAWARAEAEGAKPPEGYWFWNHGEPRPFPWEPHVYHALEAALRILGLPVWPRDAPAEAVRLGQGAVYELPLGDLGQRARQVLEVLLPRTRGRLPAGGGGVARFRIVRRDLERLEVEGSAGGEQRGPRGDPPALAFSRRVVYDLRAGAAASDEVRVDLASSAGRLTVRVGYRPADD